MKNAKAIKGLFYYQCKILSIHVTECYYTQMFIFHAVIPFILEIKLHSGIAADRKRVSRKSWNTVREMK